MRSFLAAVLAIELARQLHMQRRIWRPRPVFAGRDAAELAEIPRQMRLIVVAALTRKIRPRNLAASRDALDDAAQAIDAAVELRSQTDGVGEQRVEAARAVTRRTLNLRDAQLRRRSLH